MRCALVSHPQSLEVFETGVRYQMYHAFARADRGARRSHASTGGSVTHCRLAVHRRHCFFSLGSLYAVALSGIRTFGAITPIGGLAFLAGWALLVWAAIAR